MRTENYPAETEVPSLGPRLHNIPAFARRIIFKKVYDALRSLREPRTGHRTTARSHVGHRSPAGKHRVELFLHVQEFHLQAGRASRHQAGVAAHVIRKIRHSHLNGQRDSASSGAHFDRTYCQASAANCQSHVGAAARRKPRKLIKFSCEPHRGN
jgi:hypothetical protein